MSNVLLSVFYQSLLADLDVDAATQTVNYNFTPAGAATPQPAFTATVDSAVTSPLAPFTVQFTDTSTSPTSITGWLWTFGDDQTSTAQSPSHIYTHEGVYDVTLTVTNSAGSATQIQSGVVVVTGAVQVPEIETITGLQKSVASFTMSPTSGVHPLSVTLTDTSTNTPYQWDWDLGDGAKSSVQNPVHVFDHAGTFSVTMQVENVGGISTVSQTIVVA